MAKKPPADETPPGAPLWMATFGDLMSLLLTFFVLLISFSTIMIEDYNAAMGSLKGALGTMTEPSDRFRIIDREHPRPLSYHFRFIRHGAVAQHKERELQLLTSGPEKTNNLEDVAEQVTTYTRAAGVADMVSVDTNEKGIKIRLPAVLLFDLGSARLKTDMKTENLLKKIAELVADLPYGLSIEGHTDDRPISSQEFRSNWELSSARAVAVLEYFHSLGVNPERMQAVGHSHYQPYASNESIRGRQLNRRVEINLDVSKVL